MLFKGELNLFATVKFQSMLGWCYLRIILRLSLPMLLLRTTKLLTSDMKMVIVCYLPLVSWCVVQCRTGEVNLILLVLTSPGHHKLVETRTISTAQREREGWHVDINHITSAHASNSSLKKTQRII